MWSTYTTRWLLIKQQNGLKVLSKWWLEYATELKRFYFSYCSLPVTNRNVTAVFCYLICTFYFNCNKICSHKFHRHHFSRQPTTLLDILGTTFVMLTYKPLFTRILVYLHCNQASWTENFGDSVLLKLKRKSYLNSYFT